MQERHNFEGLLNLYLRRSRTQNVNTETVHLDDDIITAFIEGRLREKDCLSIINHLVDCVMCRRATSELVKLNTVFEDSSVSNNDQQRERFNASTSLSKIIQRFFEPAGVVFAHQQEEDVENDAPTTVKR